MSLISDALTKARQEAARQDAQRPRLPYAVGAADSPSRRRSLLPVLAGLGAGGLMAALLLVLAWSAGWGLFARPAHQAAVAQAAPATPPSAVKPAAEPLAPPEATPETARTAPPQPAAPVQETRPQPPAETRPAPPVDAPAARPAPVTTAPAEPAPSPPPLPTAPVATAPAPQAPAQPTAAAPSQGAAGLADGKSYAGEVPVPGGGAVKLNGIAFSRDHPIAVLDGRVVEPGEIVQGFTVVAIEAGRVKLQGYGATVFVSPR